MTTRLFHWGESSPTSSYINTNLAAMEAKAFDGVGPQTMVVDGYRFGYQVFSNNPVVTADVQSDIDNLVSLGASPVLGDSFYGVYMAANQANTPTVDWFSDWTIPLDNVQVLAELVRDAGLAGILIDTEHYGGYNIFHYESRPLAGSKTYQEYQDQVRLRATELVQRFNATTPNVDFLVTIGFAEFVNAFEGDYDPTTLNTYNMLPAFMDGLIQGCDAGSKVHDIAEVAYSSRTVGQLNYTLTETRNASIANSTNTTKTANQFRIGFGLWIDFSSDSNNCAARRDWHQTNFACNWFNPTEFHAAIYDRMRLADQDSYVWIYDQEPNLWTGNLLPSEYVTAMAAGKAQYLGELEIEEEMALVPIPGYWWPKHPQVNTVAGVPAISNFTMDASGETVNAIIYAPKAGDLETFEFRVGTVVLNAASVVRVSFQTVSSGSPDGTPDEYRDAVTAGITTNAWVIPGRMTSTGADGGTRRTVTAGEELAVKIAFQTFNTSDSIFVSALSSGTSNSEEYGTFPYSQNIAGNQGLVLCAALVYSDGSVYPVEGMYPMHTTTSTTFNSGSAANEIGNVVVYPITVEVDAVWVRIDLDADADLVIYNAAGSAISTTAMISTTRSTTDGRSRVVPLATPITLTAGASYYVVVKPGGSSVITYYATAQRAALMAGMPQGSVTNGSAQRVTKALAGGAWTVTDTAWTWMGLHISAIELPAKLAAGNMRGGMTN